MRIRHVVGYTTFDGETGGVFPVARTQVAALRARGIEADLVYAGRAQVEHPKWIQAARALRPPGTLGLRVVAAPNLVALAMREPSPDVLHVHLARDFTTSWVAVQARREGIPYVVQCHGMLRPPRGPSHLLLDRLLVRRAVNGAASALVFGAAEEAWLATHEPRLTIPVVNGLPGSATPSAGTKSPIFVGRLAASKHADVAVRAALGANSGIRLIGKRGDGWATVEGLLNQGGVNYLGAKERDDVLAELSNSTALVLPSADDPFPLAVVEALQRGVPVLIHRSNGLAALVAEYSAGIVLPSLEIGEWAAALRSLTGSEARWSAYSKNAETAFNDRLSEEAMMTSIVLGYRCAIAGP